MNPLMTLRSLPAAAALAAALAFAPAAQARLGETLAQCSERYGQTRATLPASVAESDPEAARFEQGPLGIIVHFKDGVAWHISYAQGHLSDLDKDRLLKENAPTGEWQPRFGELLGNVFLWQNRQAGIIACGINRKSLNSLEVMTRACADAFGRARTQRIEAATTRSDSGTRPSGS
jgi:hypothetical protein